MSKILLTTLGGVNKEYRTSSYSINGEIYEDKKFILSALDDHHKFDKIFVLGTVSSMWDAFYEYLCYNKGDILNEDNYLSINEQCSNANNNTSFESIDLKYIYDILPEKYNLKFMKFGLNEEEMIENLNILINITDSFDENTEIYLDLTHGFRSNAFYMFMVMNYINDVKNLNNNIKAIFYGMYEGTPKGTPIPILNLKIFSEISNLLKGVHDINNYGNFYTLSNSIDDSKLKNKLDQFSNSLNINYIGEVKKKLVDLNKVIDSLNKTENTLIKMIVPKALKSFSDQFSNIKDDYMFLLEISKWYYNQKKYALSYLTMRESITAFFCEKYTGSSTKENIEESNRKINQLSFSYKGMSRMEKMDPSYKKMEKLIKVFQRCRQIRNNIAHSGEEKIDSLNDINNIPKYIEDLNKLFKDKEFMSYIQNRLQF